MMRNPRPLAIGLLGAVFGLAMGLLAFYARSSRATLEEVRSNSGALLIVIALLIAFAIAIPLIDARRHEPEAEKEPTNDAATRIAQLERERRSLLRRIDVVGATALDQGLTGLGQRIVAAIAAETGAPVVLLHVAPASEPLALEVVAAVGVSSVGASSPVAARQVLISGIGVSLGATSGDQRLVVRTSSAVITPREVVLRPIRVGETTIAVVELGVLEPLSEERLIALDELTAMSGPAISHVLATEYARNLASQVRVQAATVADVTTELATVFEALADGVAVTDSTGAIVRVNAAGRRLLEISDVDGPESRKLLADASNPLLQAIKEGSSMSGMEVALKGAGGNRRIVHVHVSPLSSEDGSQAAVAVFRDVTRERVLERELRSQSTELGKHVRDLQDKQSELERATRLKSEFLANMSHELRTPLNAIIGFAEVLLDGTYGALNPKQVDCAGDVLAGGRHLLSLINDILDLSKIEAGKMELEKDDVDLSDVVMQAITLVRPQASAKAIVLKVEVSPNAFWVNADADRLRQVMVNLLSNAVKFTPKAGSVSIDARRCDDGNIRVTVKDTGIGISPANADKIFKDFSQVDGSITRRFGGTGLGLAISKRLVELQGGTIGFTSELSKGSSFFFTAMPALSKQRPAFTVPPLPMSAQRASSAAPTRVNRASHNVLVIDRDAAAGRLTGGALLESGIRPHIVRSLSQARVAATESTFDAAVVDAGVDDAQASDVIQFVCDELRLSVVVTSTLPEDELGHSLEGCVYVAKPLDRAVLVDRVRSAIAHRGGIRRALVVDSNDVDAASVKSLLEREGFSVEITRDAASARVARRRLRHDIAICELDLDDGEGNLVARELGKEIPLIILTARELDEKDLAAWQGIAHLVARKGTLSRSAFARHVTLALRKDPAEPAEPARPRILAVDDNEQNLRLMAAVLAKRGFEMIEARDASTAVSLARSEQPSIILMDVMLPDVDGLAATRTLKADPTTCRIPIIAVTANAMSGDEVKAREAGCCDYVTKPIDSAHLLRAVDEALRAAGKTAAPVGERLPTPAPIVGVA